MKRIGLLFSKNYIKLIAYLFCTRYRSKMRIGQIFMQLQKLLWVDFIFRHINYSKTSEMNTLSSTNISGDRALNVGVSAKTWRI